MVIHTHKILKREHNLIHDEQVQTRTQTWTNKHTRIRSQEEESAERPGLEETELDDLANLAAAQNTYFS